LGAIYLPATEVGGDYYDYLPLRDGSTGLVIADVAGKGVSAGLVMTAVRSIFRTASHGTSQPGRLLQQVNEQLCQEHLNGFFVTAACLCVDVPRNQLTLAVAGHEPVLLLRRDGVEVGSIARRQPALGLVEGLSYEDDACDFQPGDAFVLYTDGVSEAMNPFRNQFGVRRLQDVVAGCGGLGVPAILQRIVAALEEHVGTAPRHDDITLLVGRRLPE
jgi:phosphoserine phosphatase RsbU/P